jgi:glycosyltransferase involved in cell wall biosynthesis
MYLSVIVPAYNEEKRLPRTVKAISNYLSRQKYDWEIIVVSDGSQDKTVEIARSLKSEIRNLRIIDNKDNHGKGYVVRQGFLEGKGDYRLFTDADNSTDIKYFERMIPEFEKGYDFVIGSRDIKGAVLDPPQPWLRQRIGDVFNLMVQVVVGLWGLWDTQCGFKGITRELAEDVLPECKIDRWAFDPEILIIAKKKGYKIKEIPITWKNDLQSKVKMKHTIRMALDLFRIRWNLITKKYNI